MLENEDKIGKHIKLSGFLHCGRCGKKTQFRKYVKGTFTSKEGTVPKVLAVPRCKSCMEKK